MPLTRPAACGNAAFPITVGSSVTSPASSLSAPLVSGALAFVRGLFDTAGASPRPTIVFWLARSATGRDKSRPYVGVGESSDFELLPYLCIIRCGLPPYLGFGICYHYVWIKYYCLSSSLRALSSGLFRDCKKYFEHLLNIYLTNGGHNGLREYNGKKAKPQTTNHIKAKNERK